MNPYFRTRSLIWPWPLDRDERYMPSGLAAWTPSCSMRAAGRMELTLSEAGSMGEELGGVAEDSGEACFASVGGHAVADDAVFLGGALDLILPSVPSEVALRKAALEFQ